MIVTDKLYIINLKANLMAYRNLKYIIAIKRISSLNRGRLMSFLREKRNDLASMWGKELRQISKKGVVSTIVERV